MPGDGRTHLLTVTGACTMLGAYAQDSLLFIKVDEIMARAMLADTLTLEQLVRAWMRGWKFESDNVIVYRRCVRLGAQNTARLLYGPGHR